MRKLLLFALLLPLNAAVTLYTVCASGCTYTSLQTAMDAAVTAQGSVCAPVILLLTAGETFTGPSGGFSMNAKTCAQYIRIRSSRLGELPVGTRVAPGQVALMATLTNAAMDSSAVLAIPNGTTTKYWAIEGLRITPPSGLASANNNLVYLGSGYLPPENTLAGVSDHIILDRNYIHGVDNQDGPVRCIMLNARNVEITNNYISSCKAVGADSQAIGSIQAFGPTLVQNNFLEAAGEVYEAGGSGTGECPGCSQVTVPGMAQSGLRWVGNYMYKNPAWKVSSASGVPTHDCLVGEYYTNTSGGQKYKCTAAPNTWSTTSDTPLEFVVKNMFEQKDGQGTVVFGNVMENCWGAGQSCGAFLLSQSPGYPNHAAANYILRDFHIYGNWMRYVNVGLSFSNLNYAVSSPTVYATVQDGVNFHDNLFTNFSASFVRTLPATSLAIGFHHTNNVRVEHNTWVNHPATGSGPRNLIVGLDDVTPSMGGSNTIKNNIFGTTADADFRSGWSFTGGQNSHCWWRQIITGFNGNSVVQNNAVIEPVNGMQGAPTTGTTGDTCTAGSGSTWPAAMVQFTNVADLFTDPASDFTVKATATGAYQGADDGLDMGANIALIGWATAGSVAGTANPYLDMRWRGVVPTADGAVIQFTAYSTAACTWLAATSRTMASPAGSTGQSRVGRSGVATITGLTTKTKYWVRQTCDGGRYIDGEIVTL